MLFNQVALIKKEEKHFCSLAEVGGYMYVIMHFWRLVL